MGKYGKMMSMGVWSILFFGQQHDWRKTAPCAAITELICFSEQ
jgi:hypothetical protein